MGSEIDKLYRWFVLGGYQNSRQERLQWEKRNEEEKKRRYAQLGVKLGGPPHPGHFRFMHPNDRIAIANIEQARLALGHDDNASDDVSDYWVPESVAGSDPLSLSNRSNLDGTNSAYNGTPWDRQRFGHSPGSALLSGTSAASVYGNNGSSSDASSVGSETPDTFNMAPYGITPEVVTASAGETYRPADIFGASASQSNPGSLQSVQTANSESAGEYFGSNGRQYLGKTTDGNSK